MSINGLNPLSYIGVDSPNPAAQIVTMNQDPTVNDSLNFTLGDIWINRNTDVPNTESVFMLTSLSGGQATWTEIGAQGNVLNVLGGTNITVNTVANNATVSVNPSVVLAGSLTAGTTVTAGTGLTVTTGNINVLAGSISQVSNSNDGVASNHQFIKSHNNAVVQVGDNLGITTYLGYDGATFKESALIAIEATGTIDVGRVPCIMSFFTSPDAVGVPLERVSIDENGTVNIYEPTVGGVDALIAEGSISITGGIYTATNADNDAFADALVLQKSRNGGIIQTGDQLGTIEFEGNDGVVYSGSARIEAIATGTVGADRIPSELKFYTTFDDTVEIPEERVVIGNDGTVTINATRGGAVAITASNTIVSTDYVGGGSLVASGDLGGVPLSTTVTNATVANALTPGAGTLTVQSNTVNNANNTGFIKIYVGATTVYIPYFTNIAP